VTTPAIFVRFRPSCGPTYLLTYCLTLTCAQDQSSEVDPRDAPGGRSELLSTCACVWTTPKMLVVGQNGDVLWTTHVRYQLTCVTWSLTCVTRAAAHLCHVAAAPRRRLPAALRLVDAQRRPPATPDCRPTGPAAARTSVSRLQHGRRRLLRAQRRLGAHVDDGGRARGRVPSRSRWRKEQCQVHAGEEDHARPGWTTPRRGKDSPLKSQSERQRTETNGESASTVWHADRGRLKNRTEP